MIGSRSSGLRPRVWPRYPDTCFTGSISGNHSPVVRSISQFPQEVREHRSTSKRTFTDLSVLQALAVDDDIVGRHWFVLRKNNLFFLFTQLLNALCASQYF